MKPGHATSRRNSRVLRACRVGALVFILAAAAQAANLSLAEYQQQLHDFNARVEQIKASPDQVAQFEAEVPDKVSVSDHGREFSVSYSWMKAQLKQFEAAEAKNRPKFLQNIQDQLQLLEKESQGYQSVKETSKAESDKLNEILSRREFHKSHGPSALAIWWQKVLRWIINFLERHPIYGKRGTDLLHLLVYGSVAIAFILFAIWIKRRFAHARDDREREIIPFAPSAKGWRSWMAEAQDSAQKGDWRNAVHLAYWAGISFLEEHGAWRPDRARTPREYLRILGMRKPEYPTLSALTRKFEVIWYGHRDASASDFQETLGELEKLGCR
jgi:hypothetical protein